MKHEHPGSRPGVQTRRDALRAVAVSTAGFAGASLAPPAAAAGETASALGKSIGASGGIAVPAGVNPHSSVCPIEYCPRPRLERISADLLGMAGSSSTEAIRSPSTTL